MRIIANADDFGSSDDSVDATIEGFETGALTSATIMVNMPGTARALEYAIAHPEFSFGAHLIYCTDEFERPLCQPGTIGDLVTEGGAFLHSNTVRKKALLGRIAKDQIARETEAQLAVLSDAGVPISHVDSHGHLHKFPVFQKALRPVLAKLGVRRMRSIENVFLKKPFKKPTYWLGKLWRRRIEAHFLTTDYFYMPASSFDTAWADPLLTKLQGQASLEVGIHPCYDGQLKAELRDMQDFATKARECGHQFITWNALQ